MGSASAITCCWAGYVKKGGSKFERKLFAAIRRGEAEG